jgi:polyphosphate kinase
VPGLSDKIQVRSVLGRFLEHSRVFWFENGGEPQAWIGSADLMHRNLDRRVEVLVQIPTSGQVEQLKSLVERGFDDANSSWILGADGEWERHHLDAQGEPLADLQATLISIQRRRRDAAPVVRR